jgi:hypothetical protein
MSSTAHTMPEVTGERSGRGRGAVFGAFAIAAVGGLPFGYDTGVISAASLHISSESGLFDGIQQFVVASLLPGATASTVGARPLVDYIGRKVTLVRPSVAYRNLLVTKNRASKGIGMSLRKGASA